MSSHRAQHNFENIKRAIHTIISKLKDPRLNSGFINIVKIDISDDASSCRIFISSLNGIEKSTEAVKILTKASGHIKKELGEKLSLRYIPNLTFIPSDAVEYGINMSKKIDELISK